MASSVSIDVDSGQDKDDLQFQDIPHGDSWKPVARKDDDPGKTHTFTNFPHSAVDSDNEEDDSEKTEFIREKKRSASFWTFEYYQQFFDVETKQVGYRILGSMLPRPRGNYLDTHIRPNPDLYGPFWICTTLVFTSAIAGNLANYMQAAGQNYTWQYDFHKVTFAATAIFSYWWVVPLLLFGLLWWRGNHGQYTFLELLCIYGYSLAIYIPISILWVIQYNWLQWLLVVLGATLSGTALLLAFWPAVKEDKKQVALSVMGVIFLLHAALAMGFMLYFFHVPSAATASTPLSNITTTLAPNPPQPNLKAAQQNSDKGQQNTDSDTITSATNKGKPPDATNQEVKSGNQPEAADSSTNKENAGNSESNNAGQGLNQVAVKQNQQPDSGNSLPNDNPEQDTDKQNPQPDAGNSPPNNNPVQNVNEGRKAKMLQAA